MKNKKGFTLVEIVACLAILAFVALTSFVAIRASKKNEDEETKKQFIESVKLASGIFIDKNDTQEKFKVLKNEGDYTYIQLKDLVEIGLMDENELNPFNSKTLKEQNCDLVKVYVDDVGSWGIVYPLPDYEGANCETYDILSTKYEIYLVDNNEIGNTFYMKTSSEIYEEYLKDTTVITKIQNGTYYKDNYKIEEGTYYLRNILTGNIINTSMDDWKIDCRYYPKSITCTYAINSNSKFYKNTEDKSKQRIIKIIDNDPPIVINESNKTIYKYNNKIDEKNFTGTFTANYTSEGGIIYDDCYNKAKKYYIYFDNYDGELKDASKVTKGKELLTLKDSSNNVVKYTNKDGTKRDIPIIAIGTGKYLVDAYGNDLKEFTHISNYHYYSHEDWYSFEHIIAKINNTVPYENTSQNFVDITDPDIEKFNIRLSEEKKYGKIIKYLSTRNGQIIIKFNSSANLIYHKIKKENFDASNEMKSIQKDTVDGVEMISTAKIYKQGKPYSTVNYYNIDKEWYKGLSENMYKLSNGNYELEVLAYNGYACQTKTISFAVNPQSSTTQTTTSSMPACPNPCSSDYEYGPDASGYYCYCESGCPICGYSNTTTSSTTREASCTSEEGNCDTEYVDPCLLNPSLAECFFTETTDFVRS